MERLREIRERAGYSQMELAEKSGVSQDAISAIELGKRKPQGRTLRKLANVLDVEVEDLYGEAKFLHLMHSTASLALQTVDNIDEVVRTNDMDCERRLEYVQQFLESLRRTLENLEEGLVEAAVIEAKYEGKS